MSDGSDQIDRPVADVDSAGRAGEARAFVTGQP